MPRLFLSGYPHVCAVRTRACFVLVFLDSPFRFRCSYGSVPARRRSLPKTHPVRVRGFGACFGPPPSVRAGRQSASESPAGPCPWLRCWFSFRPRSAPAAVVLCPKSTRSLSAGFVVVRVLVLDRPLFAVVPCPKPCPLFLRGRGDHRSAHGCRPQLPSKSSPRFRMSVPAAKYCDLAPL